MTLLAKLTLAPLLLWQARGARRHAVALPEAAGPRDGEVGDGRALRLLIVGDSSAAGVGTATQDEALAGPLTRTLAAEARRRVGWQLVARSGVATPQALELLDAQALIRADIAVVVLGVNDVVEQLPPHRALLARTALVDRLRERSGVRHVVFAALPPMEQFPLLPNPLRAVVGRDARRLDAAVAAWAARRGDASHCPIAIRLGCEHMAADGFHPGPAVYRVCGAALARHLVQRVLPTLDRSAP
ncbi:MAG TPA: SGNH/GDSL hydrolase family protein [Methylibium sp.]|nr:SGNH/GDSL hydrolase family protein [Methylibium sp.]